MFAGREWTFKAAYGLLFASGIVCLALAAYWRFARRSYARVVHVQPPLLSDVSKKQKLNFTLKVHILNCQHSQQITKVNKDATCCLEKYSLFIGRHRVYKHYLSSHTYDHSATIQLFLYIRNKVLS